MRWSITVLLLVSAVILGACSGLAGEPEIVATNAPTNEPIQVSDPSQLGAAVFAARCASCHGQNGQGNGPVAIDAGLTNMPDFTNQQTSASQSFAEWTNTIRFGRLDSLMPPWENSLTEAELQAVAEYTFTLWQQSGDIAAAATPSGATSVEPVVEEAMGFVRGTVINGSEGDTLPEAISVALHVLDASLEEVDFSMEVLDSTGDYRFDDIVIRHDYRYLITAIANDAVFYSEQVFGEPDLPEIYLPVTIYEITNDPSVIELDLLLTRIIPDSEDLILQQLFNFRNTSDKLYRGINQIDGFTYESVHIPLPDDAELLNNIELVSRFVMLEEGGQRALVDTQPVVPDQEHIVEVVYTLPQPSDNAPVVISYEVPYTVNNQIELMVQPGRFHVSGDQFTAQGEQQFQFGAYDSYLAEAVPAGTTITYSIESGALEMATRDESGGISVPTVMAVAGAGLLVLSGLGFWVTSRQQPSRQVLLKQIADLDAKHEAGKLKEADYQRKRQQLKQQLVAMIEKESS
ncbi:MAG: cytochrome c [Anaerolineaceae bacterium]|nr:cytochrome c [Anaerolineaceae bacterium]